MVQDGLQALKVSGCVNHSASMVESGLVIDRHVRDLKLSKKDKLNVIYKGRHSHIKFTTIPSHPLT